MLSFLAGMAYGNAGEWIMHKYVLHELGRKRELFASKDISKSDLDAADPVER